MAQDEYEPSPLDWVRRQVELIEGSQGAEGNVTDEGWPVIVLTTRGTKSGKLRKAPLIRVEHDGRYAAVASLGGGPRNPHWYHNVRSDPRVQVRDSALVIELVARELEGEEKRLWWDRAVAVFPEYANYQERSTRVIPVFLLEPAS